MQVSVVCTFRDTEINWMKPKDLQVSKCDDASTFVIQNKVDSDSSCEGCLETRLCECVC